MLPKNAGNKSGPRTPESTENSRENPASSEHVREAFEQAEEDIKKDAELSTHHPNDDLDEGETARLGDGKNDLI